ncbi:MAG: hypothetical protein H6Q77_57 [Gemmatimonadetes bacterium]|nr:hypothetical protein [Gemmatimonadota bacterium]
MNARRAAAAGVIGTVAMTILFFLEPLLGLPRMAEGGILSTVMSATVAHVPVGFVGGWVVHFTVGIALALFYAAAVANRLPGAPAVRGALYGALVFLGAQLVVMPLVGAGFFSSGDPARVLGSLAGHLVYGGVVGWYYGRGAAA